MTVREYKECLQTIQDNNISITKLQTIQYIFNNFNKYHVKYNPNKVIKIILEEDMLLYNYTIKQLPFQIRKKIKENKIK